MGIDLGTTNSCVSILEGDELKVIQKPRRCTLLHHQWLHLKMVKLK
ncbi:Hsp70 family protein [Staphylococcus epidermidis]